MSETGKVYQIQYPTTVSGKVYNVRDVSGEQNVTGKIYQVASVNGGGGTTIRNQDKQITENGTYTADVGYTGLGTVTVNVSSGGGSATKFGVSVDTWLGDVDENGVLQKTTWTGALNFVGVKAIGNYGLDYMFYDCTGLTSVDFSSLQTIGNYGLSHTFDGCTGLTSVDFSSLQTIGDRGLNYAFNLCNKITTISFPSLTSVQTDSFGSSTTNNAFRDCTALTEIHFRADMQTTIEAMSQYANKWGATNATIYFDL